jgi:O-antigen/teichoic acid export membrane protein
MLAKADYGLAAVLGMAMTLLEISGRMAFGMQVIQSKEGDTPRYLASAHALQFVGGALSGVLIAALSVPLAHLFRVPHVWWAIALLAVVPLSQSLSHLDIARRQRELDYLPLVLVDVVPQFLITIAVWPMAVWLRDYRVILWLMIAKALIGTAMTYFFARRPYGWAWELRHIRGMLAFGWPLLLTSLVMTAYQQADQMLVGAVFSLDLLANYALAFSLVSIPWFIFSQVGGSLVLPILSRVQDEPQEFLGRYLACVENSCLVAVTSMLPLIVLGEQIVTVIYGKKYGGTGLPMALLGAAFVVRFLSFTPGYAAVARGDTINQLFSNLGRSLSLPLALLAAWLGGGVGSIAACALVGELVSAAVSLIRLRQRQAVPYRYTAGGAAYVVCFVAIGLLLVYSGAPMWGYKLAAAVLFASVAIPLLVGWYAFPSFARTVMSLVERRGLTAQAFAETPATD